MRTKLRRWSIPAKEFNNNRCLPHQDPPRCKILERYREMRSTWEKTMMTTKMKTMLRVRRTTVPAWKLLIHMILEMNSTNSKIRTIKRDQTPTWLVTWEIWPRPYRNLID